MMMLDKIDAWFMQLAVLGLTTYFLWSVRNVLNDFKEQVKALQKTIAKLFDSDRDLERRVSTIEGRCEAVHGALSGGRREYDPEERPDHG